MNSKRTEPDEQLDSQERCKPEHEHLLRANAASAEP